MNHRKIVVASAVILSMATHICSGESNGDQKPAKVNRLLAWTLVEGAALLGSAVARYSPAAAGGLQLLTMANTRPSGNSRAAQVSSQVSLLVLSGYDFYAENNVPHNRMFWQQFAGLHIVMFTPMIIDHFLGYKVTEKELSSWNMGVAMAPKGLRLTAHYRFGARKEDEK